MSCDAVDAELRFDLPEGAFGAVEGELQFARLEPDEDVARADFGSELHGNVPHDARDFAADARLIGREKRALKVDLPL